MHTENSFKKIFTTVLLMVLSATVGGGSVYYSLKTSSETETQDLQNQVNSLQSQIAQTEQAGTATVTPAASPSETPSPTPTAAPADTFDWKTVKVGDKIASMTVKSKTDTEVAFNGEATITGSYTNKNNQICITKMTDASLKLLPKVMPADNRSSEFCFSNITTAAKSFPKGTSGTATIVIDQYTLKATGVEGKYMAELVKATSKK